MQELARVMTQNGSVYVYEKEDGSLVEISYAPYGSERTDIACITHDDSTESIRIVTAAPDDIQSLCEYEPIEFVTCDEITGYVGTWLEADTSDIPVEAVKHLQEACSICSKELEKPLEDDALEKFKDDTETIPSNLNGSLLREGIAVNTGEYEFGTLIPMYHGSGIVIGEFSQDRMNCGAMGEGIYFTSVFEEACDYAIDALGVEVATGKYLWNGEVYEYGCLCEELENRGYVKSYYLLVEDEDDITHSKYGNNGVVAVVRDVRQIFPRNQEI